MVRLPLAAQLRVLIPVATLLSLAVPLESHAQQQAAKTATIGYLSAVAGRTSSTDAFEQALHDLGWASSRNIRIEYRYAAGRHEAMSALADELVGLRVDVVVARTIAGALAAKRSTGQIPVVFLAVPDPVGTGLVPDLAHPGGNVTGVSWDASPEQYANGLQYLKEAVPSLRNVAQVGSSEAVATEATQKFHAAAKALGLELYEVEVVKAPQELDAAVRRAKARGAQGLYFVPSGFTSTFAKQCAESALAARLPPLHGFGANVVAGGLLSYSPSLLDIARRGASYVDKILKGTKPGDLPVEQPARFEFTINLKTASALGLTIPSSLLIRADQVIR